MIQSDSKSDAEAALREAQNWIAPLPADRMFGLLGELYLRTVRRDEGDSDREGLLRLYVRELSNYPGDVVSDAITAYRGKFFPALAELQEPIERDRRIVERKQRIDALRTFLNGAQDERPKGPPPTEEQIERNERHFQNSEETFYSAAALANLERVDKKLGDKAKAPGGKFKTIGEISKRIRPA